MKQEVAKTQKLMDNTINQVKQLDESRNLNSLGTRRSESIKFPQFTGKQGEDFVTFKKEVPAINWVAGQLQCYLHCQPTEHMISLWTWPAWGVAGLSSGDSPTNRQSHSHTNSCCFFCQPWIRFEWGVHTHSRHYKRKRFPSVIYIVDNFIFYWSWFWFWEGAQ